MTLKELPIGKTATVRTVGGEGALRQHFLDMGIIPGAEVTMVKYAPMGDPVEVRIHSYELTLRLADAGRIAIDEMRDAVKEKEQPDAKAIPHPGFGEGGKYHNKAEEHPLPEGELLSFALAGNQNCGKTTLFNQLTGSNQHVGNFPGVTVDRKDGEIRGQKHAGHRSSRHLFDVAVFKRRDRHPEFRSERASARHHQYCRCDKYRTKPVSDDAADGTRRSDGTGPQHDG